MMTQEIELAAEWAAKVLQAREVTSADQLMTVVSAINQGQRYVRAVPVAGRAGHYFLAKIIEEANEYTQHFQHVSVDCHHSGLEVIASASDVTQEALDEFCDLWGAALYAAFASRRFPMTFMVVGHPSYRRLSDAVDRWNDRQESRGRVNPVYPIVKEWLGRRRGSVQSTDNLLECVPFIRLTEDEIRHYDVTYKYFHENGI